MSGFSPNTGTPCSREALHDLCVRLGRRRHHDALDPGQVVSALPLLLLRLPRARPPRLSADVTATVTSLPSATRSRRTNLPHRPQPTSPTRIRARTRGPLQARRRGTTLPNRASYWTRCRRSGRSRAARSRIAISRSRALTETDSRRSPQRRTPSAESGVVILPDVRGCDRFYEELRPPLRRTGHCRHRNRLLRAHGLYRGARRPLRVHGTRRADDSGGGFGGDVAAAVEWLRQAGSTSIFTVGCCFGGRN